LGELLTTPPREKPLLRNIHKARCFLWRQNNPEVNYSTTRISGGEVILEEVSRSRKMDILLGTWNVRSLYRAGLLTAAVRIFEKWERVETGWSWLRIWTDGGHL